MDQDLQAAELVEAVGEQPRVLGGRHDPIGDAQDSRPLVLGCLRLAAGAGGQDQQPPVVARRRVRQAVVGLEQVLGSDDAVTDAAARGDQRVVPEPVAQLDDGVVGGRDRVDADLGAGQGGGRHEGPGGAELRLEDGEALDPARPQGGGGRLGLPSQCGIGQLTVGADGGGTVRHGCRGRAQQFDHGVGTTASGRAADIMP